jgi:flagellin
MSSLLTNNSAMNALATLRYVNRAQGVNQDRISTGLQVQSAKDNAAYFSIAKTMSSDSGMFKSIDEGLTMTKNSIATARLGSEEVLSLASEFTNRVAFAAADSVDRAEVQKELDELVARVQTAIDQSAFNGNDLVSGPSSTQTVVTGVTRSSGSLATTTVTFDSVDLGAIQSILSNIDIATVGSLSTQLTAAEGALAAAIDASTSLGVAENTVESQKMFLENLVDVLDQGVGAMIDADMEEEAAMSAALQVQQQMAIQSLSIANQKPQALLSLFR